MKKNSFQKVNKQKNYNEKQVKSNQEEDRIIKNQYQITDRQNYDIEKKSKDVSLQKNNFDISKNEKNKDNAIIDELKNKIDNL